MTRNELDRVLELHGLWLDDEGGERANLSGADLHGADLTGANLRYAHLASVNLRGADVSDANLTDAYLSGANLSGANLSGANLRRANLLAADLRGVRTNFITRMTARGAVSLSDKQRRQLGMQGPPRAGNTRRARSSSAGLASRLLR